MYVTVEQTLFNYSTFANQSLIHKSFVNRLVIAVNCYTFNRASSALDLKMQIWFIDCISINN